MAADCMLCGDRATGGAYVLSDKAPFKCALLCKEHGDIAVSKGARHMKWRPKCLTGKVNDGS